MSNLPCLAALLLVPLPVLSAAESLAANEKPNILFIVADDLGYADCGAHGCRDIPTPNLDALAASGVRFTDGYVTGAVCSPSRCSLMTGRYQQRDGVPDWIPAGKRGMNADVPTVAAYLRNAGYRTALVGKWHLGEQEECNPLNRGFDEFFGFLGGGRNYFPDPPQSAGAKVDHYTQLVHGSEAVIETEYTTHAFAREAVNFISRQQGKSRPFFLYLAFNAVHTPMQAPEDYLRRFASISDKKRRTYAGMLSAMDDDIGRVLKAVREAGIEEKTLICFISDNGGPIDGVNLMPFLIGGWKTPHRELCWEYGRQWAIRRGPWKLTFALPSKEAKVPVLGLYDLSRDIGESHDLASEQPERVKQLQAARAGWRKSVEGDRSAPEVRMKDVNSTP